MDISGRPRKFGFRGGTQHYLTMTPELLQQASARFATYAFPEAIHFWNGIPGLTPVKKFTDRKLAVTRIWKAIQILNGGVPKAAPSREQKAERMIAPWSACPNKVA